MSEDNGKIVPMTVPAPDNPEGRVKDLESQLSQARAAAAMRMAESAEDAKDAELLGKLKALGVEQKTDAATLWAVAMQEFANSCSRCDNSRRELAKASAILHSCRHIPAQRERMRAKIKEVSDGLQQDEAAQLVMRADIKKYADQAKEEAAKAAVPEVPAAEPETEEAASPEPPTPGAKP